MIAPIVLAYIFAAIGGTAMAIRFKHDREQEEKE